MENEETDITKSVKVEVNYVEDTNLTPKIRFTSLNNLINKPPTEIKTEVKLEFATEHVTDNPHLDYMDDDTETVCDPGRDEEVLNDLNDIESALNADVMGVKPEFELALDIQQQNITNSINTTDTQSHITTEVEDGEIAGGLPSTRATENLPYLTFKSDDSFDIFYKERLFQKVNDAKCVVKKFSEYIKYHTVEFANYIDYNERQYDGFFCKFDSPKQCPIEKSLSGRWKLKIDKLIEANDISDRVLTPENSRVVFSIKRSVDTIKVENEDEFSDLPPYVERLMKLFENFLNSSKVIQTEASRDPSATKKQKKEFYELQLRSNYKCEIMAIVLGYNITSDMTSSLKNYFMDGKCSNLISIYSRTLNGKKSFTDFLYGERLMIERAGHIKLKISPWINFYSNVAGVELLSETIYEIINTYDYQTVLMAGCGLGLINLILSTHIRNIIGTDVTSMLKDAEEVRKYNNINNVRYIESDNEKKMSVILNELKSKQFFVILNNCSSDGRSPSLIGKLHEMANLKHIILLTVFQANHSKCLSKLFEPSDDNTICPFIPVQGCVVDPTPSSNHYQIVVLLERSPTLSISIDRNIWSTENKFVKNELKKCELSSNEKNEKYPPENSISSLRNDPRIKRTSEKKQQRGDNETSQRRDDNERSQRRSHLSNERNIENLCIKVERAVETVNERTLHLDGVIKEKSSYRYEGEKDIRTDPRIRKIEERNQKKHQRDDSERSQLRLRLSSDRNVENVHIKSERNMENLHERNEVCKEKYMRIDPGIKWVEDNNQKKQRKDEGEQNKRMSHVLNEKNIENMHIKGEHVITNSSENNYLYEDKSSNNEKEREMRINSKIRHLKKKDKKKHQKDDNERSKQKSHLLDERNEEKIHIKSEEAMAISDEKNDFFGEKLSSKNEEDKDTRIDTGIRWTDEQILRKKQKAENKRSQQRPDLSNERFVKNVDTRAECTTENVHIRNDVFGKKNLSKEEGKKDIQNGEWEYKHKHNNNEENASSNSSKNKMSSFLSIMEVLKEQEEYLLRFKNLIDNNFSKFDAAVGIKMKRYLKSVHEKNNRLKKHVTATLNETTEYPDEKSPVFKSSGKRKYLESEELPKFKKAASSKIDLATYRMKYSHKEKEKSVSNKDLSSFSSNISSYHRKSEEDSKRSQYVYDNVQEVSMSTSEDDDHIPVMENGSRSNYRYNSDYNSLNRNYCDQQMPSTSQNYQMTHQYTNDQNYYMGHGYDPYSCNSVYYRNLP